VVKLDGGRPRVRVKDLSFPPCRSGVLVRVGASERRHAPPVTHYLHLFDIVSGGVQTVPHFC
jgi:hypothetical protein